MTDQACHPGLPAELRLLVTVALDRIAPMIERIRTEPAGEGSSACGSCPVCAVIAALRGERPEMAVRLAVQAAGVLAALRAALEDDVPEAPQPAATPGGRTVQHIHVERVERVGARS